MDPDATLAQALEAARALADGINPGSASHADAADGLADAVLELDEWLAKGGHLPVRWRPTALPPELRA